MIEAGLIDVEGVATPGPASLVAGDTAIRLAKPAPAFVSRGGDKLDGALRHLDVRVTGRRWLDAGASTGGFTDRLLKGGAAAVAAVDVGYGQLAWELRNDPRVFVLERTNVRDLAPGMLPWEPEAAVADLSFISLKVVLPALAQLVAGNGDHVLLVKPQFEVGREDVGRGVVRDPALWSSAIRGVVESAQRLELGLVDVAASRLAGPAGNREFFVHLRRGAPATETEALIDAAIASVS